MSPLLITFLIAISLNLIVFLFAYKKQTDHYTDMTYSLTFMIVAVVAIWQTSDTQMPQWLLLAMVFIWAIRLGSYLFIRIGRIGVDHRFDKMRPVWKRYIRFWILQGMSVWLVATPYIIALSSGKEIVSLLPIQIAGFCIWLVGFFLETIADLQKYKYRNDTTNDGQFMQSGLFSVIQYPNYLGEMMVWIGVFIYAIPYLEGFNWLSIISPIWIVTLLLFISGIPYLRKQSEGRYGHLDTFQTYKKKTARLIPFLY